MIIGVWQVKEITDDGLVTPSAAIDGELWFAPFYPTVESAHARIHQLLELASGGNSSQTIQPEWTVIQVFGWGEGFESFKI